MGDDGLELDELFRVCICDANVDGCRLRPLEVHEYAVETRAILNLEAAPERRTGYKDRTPMLTDVRGSNQTPLAGAMFENPGQDLWRKLVDGNKRVLDRPDRPRNLGEIAFDAMDL